MKDYILIKIKTVRMGCAAAFIAVITGLVIHMLVTKLHNSNNENSPENSSYNTLTADGRPLIYFKDISGDSSFTDISVSPDSVRFGRELNFSNERLHLIVKRYREHIRKKTMSLDSVMDEIGYYLEVHNVQDEGYDMIVGHFESVGKNYSMLRHIDSVLNSITEHSALGINRIVRQDCTKCKNPVFIECNGGIWQKGKWLKLKRSGKGIATDHAGRIICGTWHDDTLTIGRRTDAYGTYYGQFDSLLTPSGHGCYTSNDGSYYEGHWHGDARDGFGFEVNPSRMRAGEWKADTYRGERMHYTSERIYGIDISRYQHGKGRKYYPIQWNRLRIKHLGNISKKRISGDVDYPVSFIYIKSTEGVSVRNRYYANDYKQARRHGLHCGAYHFFSTKTSASAQAQYFIRHSFFRKGDLPPVLDVEPTHNQIMKMGGEKFLLNAIRTWMKIVMQHTGVKPILYVNQTFVNRYLADAPDIKRNYNIWIARYGEYRPDVRLIYWQLCPDGKISGIHGDVDINVFNGYKDKFDSFLETELIK